MQVFDNYALVDYVRYTYQDKSQTYNFSPGEADADGNFSGKTTKAEEENWWGKWKAVKDKDGYLLIGNPDALEAKKKEIAEGTFYVPIWELKGGPADGPSEGLLNEVPERGVESPR